MDINLEIVTSVLWEVYKVKQEPLSKSDLLGLGLPSYNKLLANGFKLREVNSEFCYKYYEDNPKFCRWCNLKIPFSKRVNDYCGSSCSATSNNIGRVRLTKSEDTDLTQARNRKYLIDKSGDKPSFVILTNCVNCNLEIAENIQYNRKYCSSSCQKDYQFEERFRDWYEFGKNFSNRTLREFLKVINGYFCDTCGISEWNGKSIVLEVEHIDGNSDKSSPENICLICPNCHSQTPTYKAKNIGNGRHYRRLRYQEGKSY